ncbi:MAG TPA: 2-C-methyl-D-erythritol 2,4-cyclodiphosphate synthase [Bacteroidales bacterium]|nr:MAG: 2-C-methyl-D-erythritol 2,4-cyclodiphosphate synthase [Bacteroidetes bacterium ADurb.Bin037]HPV88247.1 2-C-methyl-D-erythritol 2,4-cyclodiphosphate synthase [Bacteroidales bacterium]HPW78566.1 2-C-methyl-D-erythritol 2,4-cyclodiphosphate synthase [Bacteroidales bacterium]HQB55777.1 2-C-methyl-D-erythritol 2,4-cyclodiphosphate synthase [Bacteroidales bacterium]
MKNTAATNTRASNGNGFPVSGKTDPLPANTAFCIDSLPRIGNGFDVHTLAPGLPFFLGGIRIKHSKGCVAHSDGDCLLHALCDAMLGALALGDIGKHFPDTSDEYKGIDSKILLKKTYQLIRKAGYRPGNVDCTVCLQAPKISDKIAKMREVIAGILEMTPGTVSIKATTTERLGFVGREEGVATYATVLLYPEV